MKFPGGHMVLRAGRGALHAALGPGRPRMRRPPDGPVEGTAWWVGRPWEAVRSAGLFDAAWYRSAYPAVAETRIDPMWQYATQGARQGHNPNPMFDTAWYLTTYPDVAGAGANPLLHYVEHGAREGRDPGPRFDTAWYVRTNPDVRTARLNPLGHYLVAGEREGRRPRPLPGRARGTTSVTVVLVSGEPDTPGHRYRVVHFAEAVRRLGGEATVLTVPEAALDRISAVDHADVVLLWRAVWGPEIERVVRRARGAGAVLVFDVDDLMVDPDLATVVTVDGIRSQGLTEVEAAHWFAKMRRTAEECDACTCTTSELAARLRQLGKPAYVLPNGFDDHTFLRSRLARRTRQSVPDDGACRIGYASGSLTHQRDFALVASATASVLRTHPETRLVLYRGGLDLDEFPAFDDLRAQVEWRAIVPLDALPVELSRLDVNLAPLEVGNPFCEAKSDLKFFEAALVDVPTIASPSEQHRAVIAHGENGLLAGDDDAWRDALVRLVADAGRRRCMGRAAHRSVLWSHGPERRTQAIKAIVDQLLDADAAADAFELELLRARRPQTPPPEPARTDRVVEHDRLREAWITVVIPVHDYRDLVVEALESVAAQTLADLDLVVVDDGSTDDSLAVVKGWLETNAARFNRALLLSHATCTGVASARNAGFDAAETPFVLPLDADNLLVPGCCERLLEALDGSAAAFAYPRIRHVGETSPLLEAGAVRGYLPYAPQRLVASNYIDAMALIRKGAWAAAGGYRQGLLGWEDYDLWCRFAELGLYGKQVAEDLALYRIHDASMLHTVTHGSDRLGEVHEAITREHPWLRLETADGATGKADEAPPLRLTPKPPPPRPPSMRELVSEPGRLSARSRRILPMLRCPETGGRLVEAPEGGLVSVDGGRVWPVVHGRPVLVAGAVTAEVFPSEHRGNPLPARALDLIAQASGMVLHLSGGGTRAGGDRVVALDAAVFGPTDVVGDAHRLPFADGEFDLVVAMNAFEHYREPSMVVGELRRVLRPGGLVFLHTAFLQPLHEGPDHYFNCTRFGLEQWFTGFETVDLSVPDNLHPAYAISWLASDAEEVLAQAASPAAAALFRDSTIGTFSDFWRDPTTRDDDERWDALSKLTGLATGANASPPASSTSVAGRADRRRGLTRTAVAPVGPTWTRRPPPAPPGSGRRTGPGDPKAPRPRCAPVRRPGRRRTPGPSPPLARAG